MTDGNTACRGPAFARVRAVCVLLQFLPALAAAASAGEELATRGAPNVPACASCHGAKGEGQAAAGFPGLAGQSEAYLVKQLADFAAGRRRNEVMAPVAKAMSEAQRKAASAYFAGLPPAGGGQGAPTASAAPAATAGGARSTVSAQQASPGEKLARRGDWDHGIPACFACHGPAGQGVGTHFPAIAGQWSGYTARQLRDWKSGARANDPQGLMKSVAARLSEAQIDAVADWLQRAPVARGGSGR